MSKERLTHAVQIVKVGKTWRAVALSLGTSTAGACEHASIVEAVKGCIRELQAIERLRAREMAQTKTRPKTWFVRKEGVTYERKAKRR